MLKIVITISTFILFSIAPSLLHATPHSHGQRSHDHALPKQGVKHRHGKSAYGQSNSNRPVARQDKKVSSGGRGNKYIDFVKSVKNGIPVLPISSLQNLEFSNFILCALKSPQALVDAEVQASYRAFKRRTFSNAFEKRRATQAHQNKLNNLVAEAGKKCKGITAPVFYSDMIVPVTDTSIRGNTAYLDLQYEITFKGKRYAGKNKRLSMNGVHKYAVQSGSARSGFPTTIKMTISEMEQLFLTSKYYQGNQKRFKRKKEITGKVYHSLSTRFNSDFGNKYTFRLQPEYYELKNYKGNYSSFKPHRRTDRKYNNKSSYVMFNGQ